MTAPLESTLATLGSNTAVVIATTVAAIVTFLGIRNSHRHEETIVRNVTRTEERAEERIERIVREIEQRNERDSDPK